MGIKFNLQGDTQELGKAVNIKFTGDVTGEINDFDMSKDVSITLTSVGNSTGGGQEAAKYVEQAQQSANNAEDSANRAENAAQSIESAIQVTEDAANRAELAAQNSAKAAAQSETAKGYAEDAKDLAQKAAEAAYRYAQKWNANVIREMQYNIGDIATAAGLLSYLRLECVVAGTTAIEEPNFFDADAGQLITDGSVIWIVDDIRDGTPVGTVRGSLYLPKGYIQANGATVQRADYPRLVNFANENNLWREDDEQADEYLGLFGKGDGNETFVLPDYRERWIKFSANEAGNAIIAGIPNRIFLFRNALQVPSSYNDSSNEPIYPSTDSPGVNKGIALSSSSGIKVYWSTYCDLSRMDNCYGAADTVQPQSINLLPILKY